MVRREKFRLQKRGAVVAYGTGVVRRKAVEGRRIHLPNENAAVSDFGGRLEALGETLPLLFAHAQTVDDEFERRDLFRQIGRLLHFMRDALRNKARVALRTPGGESAYRRFVRLRQRCGDENPRLNRALERSLDHFRHDLRGEGFAVLGTERLSRPGEEQTQRVGEFRDRADGGAGISHQSLLFDRDGGGKVFDRLHIRPRQKVHRLPRPNRKALHISSLRFGVERIEGKRALSRPRHAGDDGHGVERDLHRDVLQIVRARAAHADDFGIRHLGSLRKRAWRLR